MIAADTSSMIAFFQEEEGKDVALVENALTSMCLALPPVVIAELFSDATLPELHREYLTKLPRLTCEPYCWERIGEMRAQLLQQGKKAWLADCMIAQLCIDAKTPLITRDKDFRHFVPFGLKLA